MFRPIDIENKIEVTQFYTFHYFEFSNDYKFEGEKHGFYELIYVDNGCVHIQLNDESFFLSQGGDIIILEPMSFHVLSADNKNALNLVVMSFNCSIQDKALKTNTVYQTKKIVKNYLAIVIAECRATFFCQS